MAHHAVPSMLPRHTNAVVVLAQASRSDATVVYPAGEAEYRVLAERLVSLVERHGGARPAIVADTDLMPTYDTPLPVALRAHPLVLLGSLNTNRALMPLYANLYCATDATFPGAEGYDLRTIANPYGTGSNVLLVGGSTLRGVERGIERLQIYIERSAGPDGVALPFILDVDLEPELARKLAEWPDTPLDVPLPSMAQGMKKAVGFNVGLLHAVGSYGLMFGLTGDRRYGLYARDCLRLLNEAMTDSYGDWHYRAERIMRTLPWLTASGLLSDEDIQRTDSLLLNTALGTEGMWWRMRTGTPPLGHRHHGKGTYEFLLIARYLLGQCQPNDTAQALCETWIEECHAFLDAMAVARVDDQDDETALNNASTLYWYALGEERYDFFTSGNARLVAERAVALHDSMGAGAGWGGYGESHSGVMYIQNEATTALAASAFFYQDGCYKWILDTMPNLALPLRLGFLDFVPPYLHKFDTGPELVPARPEGLIGVQALSATPHQLTINACPPEHIEYQGHMVNAPETWLLGEGVGPSTVPGERALDKVVLRGGFEPEAAYLLLQGYQGGYRWQGFMQAANCIVRYTQHGHIFLIQNTGRHSQFYKNGLYISDGYNNTPLPPFAERLAIADFAHIGITATRASGYHNADWTRHLFWSKRGDGFFVVLDSVVTRAEGPFSFTCTWRTPGFATLEGRVWQADQGRHHFMLCASEDLDAASVEEPENGASRPTVLRQVKAGHYANGAHECFQNLFHTRPQATPAALDLRHISASQALVMRQGYPVALCSISTDGEPIDVGSLLAQGHSAWITESEVALAGITALELPGLDWYITSDQPLNVLFDLDACSLRLIVEHPLPEKPDVAVSLGEQGPVAVGDGHIALSADDSKALAKLVHAILNDARPQDGEQHHMRVAEGGWQPGWHYDMGTRLPERIRNVTVEATPPPADGFADQLVDTMLPERREAWVQWPEAPIYDISLTLPGAPYVDHLRVVGDSQDDPTLRTFFPLPDGIQVTARTHGGSRTVAAPPEPGWAGFKRYRDMEDQLQAVTFEIGQRADRLDLHVPSPQTHPLVLHEVEIYGKRTAPAEVLRWIVEDLDGDGRAEIVLANAAHELIVLDDAGQERWRRTLPNRVTHLSCHQLSSGPERSICVGVLGGRLLVLTPWGESLLDVNLAEQFHQRVDAYAGWLNAIHEIAVWQRTPDGRAALAVGGYAIVVFLDLEGAILGHSWLDSAWALNMLVAPDSAPNPGDLWVRSGWNHGIGFYEGRPGLAPSGEAVSFGGVQQPMFRMLRRMIPFVTGETVAFEWLEPGVSILAAAEVGFGVLSAADRDWRWKIEGGTPLATCLAQNGVVITGGEDGFIAAYNAATGQPLRRKYLGARVVGLAVLDAGTLVAATRSGVLLLDQNWAITGYHAIAARGLKRLDPQRVIVLRDGQTLHMLAREEA